MSGRPVQLLTAAIAAAASLISISTASAGCYSSCGYGYAAPVAYYSAPVVYSYSYSAPVSYAAPCSPCGYRSYGYASYGYASAPMYVVNQGGAYNAPVVGLAEDTYDYGYSRAYPYYGGAVGYGYRRYGLGYRGYGLGYRGWGYRGYRAGWGYRGGFGYRGGWGYRGGLRGWNVGPRRHMGMMHHRMHGMQHHRMHGMQHHRTPGTTHPMGPRRKMP
jgi:hypothetical protein